MIALSGLIGVSIIAVFISAIRLSYAVETRSKPEGGGFGLPRYTNIWGVALNMGVAGDEETQALRRRVNQRLAVIAGLFVLMVLVQWGIR